MFVSRALFPKTMSFRPLADNPRIRIFPINIEIMMSSYKPLQTHDNEVGLSKVNDIFPFHFIIHLFVLITFFSTSPSLTRGTP